MLKRTVLTCLIALPAAWNAAAAQTPGRGMLLASADSLDGTMFEHTVVLVVHHDDDGSIGIMINRPTNLEPAAVFPDVAGAESYTGVVYFGGPLAPARPYLIARQSESISETGIRIVGDVYLSGDPSVLGNLAADRLSEAYVRIYAGSAQWGAGQLQAEIDSGAWEVVAGNATMIFSAEPESLWARVMAAPRGTDIAQAEPAPVQAAHRIRLAAD